MAGKKKSVFPKELLVTYEEPENARDEAYFISHEGGLGSIEESNDGEPVAIYQLVEVKTLKVTKELK